MEISYELKAEDFYQFGREIARNKPQPEPIFTILVITYLLFIFADIIYSLFFGTLKDWGATDFLFSLFVRTGLMFAVIGFVLVIIKLISRKKNADVKKEIPNGLLCAHRIVIEQKEMLEITDVNTSRYAWKAIGDIKELESFLVIDILMSGSYIIPKRYFQDSKQINDFLESAKQFKQNAENSYQLSHLIEYDKNVE